MGRNHVIIEQYKEAVKKYPKLSQPILVDKFWRITGIIDVIDDEGGYWDSYDVIILIPSSYPEDLPYLIENGKKIERNIDWHIDSAGICCLSTRSKMFHDLAGKVTLLRWLDIFAHPFLANHVYRKQTGRYAHEEFAHGIPGIVQGWKKILKVDSVSKILTYLAHITGNELYLKNKPCFCGSGKKYKRCYLLNRANHRFNIPGQSIRYDMFAIRKGNFN